MADITTYNPVNAVERRRQMAQNPAVLGVLEPLEKSVFLASISKTIGEYDTRELSTELAKALRFIFKDTGYRSTDESEMGYLVIRVCEILKRYYANFTLKDFRMAFEMCITGELDEYLPKGRDGQADRGHYQQFNAEYVCKVLNAYKSRRGWIMKKANEAIPNPEPERNPEVEEFYHNLTRQNVILAYEYFKDKGHMPPMSPIAEMLYYNVLSSVGLANEIEVTPAEQAEILKRTINGFVRKGKMGDANRMREMGLDAPEIQQGAFALARRKALKDTFAKMVADGINITDYIKLD